jgi:hypothetical protein
MAFYAQLNNDNKVLQVIVGDDDREDAFQWLADNIGGRWVETTTDNYAGIGWTYVEDLGFYSPQPFASWTINGLIWEAPTPKPEGDFYWDEALLTWIAYDIS